MRGAASTEQAGNPSRRLRWITLAAIRDAIDEAAPQRGPLRYLIAYFGAFAFMLIIPHLGHSPFSAFHEFGHIIAAWLSGGNGYYYSSTRAGIDVADKYSEFVSAAGIYGHILLGGLFACVTLYFRRFMWVGLGAWWTGNVDMRRGWPYSGDFGTLSHETRALAETLLLPWAIMVAILVGIFIVGSMNRTYQELVRQSARG